MLDRGSVLPSRRRLALVLLGLSILAGCSEPVGQVSGKLTHKNQPVVGAEVVFQSEQNPEERFVGLSFAEGNYQISYRTLRGLPVGRYRVTISHYTRPGGKPLPPGEEGNILKSEGQAAKHDYVFVKDITSGKNRIDLELTEGKKAKL